MSMSAEHAEELKDEPAVVCCRTEEGTILGVENLEDPDIFPDMMESGLLTIPDNSLKVGQVIGSKLIKTIDSLTPISSDIVEVDKTGEKSNRDSKVEKRKLNLPQEKAVLKYNLKKGDIIKPEDLENPMHFEKYEDSLLIKLDNKVLTREEVIGTKLKEDVVALTSLNISMIERTDKKVSKTFSFDTEVDGSGRFLSLKIKEGKGIYIELPFR
ncbi:proline reductase [Clostridium niameyense]|uniref:Proline reductase n=1 Tax=Clostridium niameyense TaxID=1622073 RepID=A0A6M0R710_9CLOT|nr:proline reductase [Clostridium niameyense]